MFSDIIQVMIGIKKYNNNKSYICRTKEGTCFETGSSEPLLKRLKVCKASNKSKRGHKRRLHRKTTFKHVYFQETPKIL